MINASRSFSAKIAAAVALALSCTTPALAEPGDLTGNWSGGGAVIYSTGSKEKARCRAQFNKIGSTSYSMSATCATASGKVAQSATLRKSGGNSYSGQFRNPEYNVTGSIRVTVNGNSQNVSMSSEAGSASFSMSRL
ncbi:MAG: hypothetical protein ABL894_11295 [Hyphomicrobium sp.]